MRVVSHRKLKEFYESDGNEDAKVSLERWYEITENAEWKNFSQLRKDFPSADFVGNQHVVFNIKGNQIRLIVVVKYIMGYVFVRWVGRHSDYDKIDASRI